MLGYHTYVYIVPDLEIGVFHTFNLATTKQQREMISAYILDVVLGEERWFTATNVCDAGSRISDDLDWDSHDLLSSVFPAQQRTLVSMKSTWNTSVTDYMGDYGHFFYGNVTITSVEVGDDTVLQLLYGAGDYLLSPTEQDPDHFDTIGNNEFSPFINMGTVEFGRDNSDLVVTLTISAMESFDPPVFIRGLQMDDAPPPDINNC